MKRCPSCAEEIQEEAIKCRYCSTELQALSKGGSVGIAEKERGSDEKGSAALGRRGGSLIGIMIIVTAASSILAGKFYLDARRYRQGAELAKSETLEAQSQTLAVREELNEALADLEEARSSSAAARTQAEAIRREPRLLHSGKLLVRVGLYSSVPIENAGRYETIYGSFEAPTNQVVTVRILTEKEFLRLKAGEKAEGPRWSNVRGDFSLEPTEDTYFVVVDHENFLSSAEVKLTVNGRPR